MRAWWEKYNPPAIIVGHKVRRLIDLPSHYREMIIQIDGRTDQYLALPRTLLRRKDRAATAESHIKTFIEGLT